MMPELHEILEQHKKWLNGDRGGIAANLRQADLQGAVLRKADLRCANFWYANLQGVDLHAADLRRTNFTDANLQGANLSEAYMEGADLRRADLAKASLRRADMWGTNLIGAKLYEADLQEATLEGANLTSANFSRATLVHVNLHGATLEGASFAEANLFEADLSGASINRTNFHGAFLQGTRFFGADLTGSKTIVPERVTPLLLLYEQPGKIRAYKLVNALYQSPYISRFEYHVGCKLEVSDANSDPTLFCGAGINVATLDWCLSRWREGFHIMIVEFTAADIAVIPTATDGKFRLYRCEVVGEKIIDPVTLRLQEAESYNV